MQGARPMGLQLKALESSLNFRLLVLVLNFGSNIKFKV